MTVSDMELRICTKQDVSRDANNCYYTFIKAEGLS